MRIRRRGSRCRIDHCLSRHTAVFSCEEHTPRRDVDARRVRDLARSRAREYCCSVSIGSAGAGVAAGAGAAGAGAAAASAASASTAAATMSASMSESSESIFETRRDCKRGLRSVDRGFTAKKWLPDRQKCAVHDVTTLVTTLFTTFTTRPVVRKHRLK